MGLTLANLRAEVLAECGIDATDLDATGSANLDLIINQSYWDVMDKFSFREKETYTSFALTIGTYIYNLSSKIQTAASVTFEALRRVYVYNSDELKDKELTEVSLEKFKERHSEDTNARDIPNAFLRIGGEIHLDPVPDKAYTLKPFFLKTLSDVPTAGPEIPQSWHEIVKDGAIWRVHKRFRDYNSAEQIKRIQDIAISRALTVPSKEDSFKKLAGVELPHLPSGRRY